MSSAHLPGFYGRLAMAVLRHRRATLLAVLVITLLGGFFAARLRVDSDLLALMPQDEPATRALKTLDEQEGGINFLTIAIQGEDDEKRDAWLDAVGARIEAMPEVDYVLWQVEPDLAMRLGVLQIPKGDLAVMRDRIQAAIALGPAVANPIIAARLLDLGPMTERLKHAGSPLQLGDGEHVGRLIVRPTGSAHDLPFARDFMREIQRVLDESDAAAHGVTIQWLGGAYRHNVEDYEGIIRDTGWTTAASAVMVLIIISAAFRTPRSLVVIFAPLLVSNLWTLGVAGASGATLNTFTSFVNAVLIGLGVEFGVHLYARYREQRVGGHPVEEAIVRAWDLVGSACTSAALTSAAGFAALVAAHFAGFRQLGWLLSFGLLLCLVAELVCMPLLLVWLDHEPTEPRHKGRHRRRRRIPSYYRLAPMTLMVIGIITFVCAVFIPRIQFEYDLSELRRSGLAYEDLSEAEQALARDSYAPLVVSYPSAEALDAGYERIRQRIAEGRAPEFASALSIRTVLPVDQDEKLALLQQIKALGEHENAVYLPPPVRENIGRLSGVPLDPMRPEDLPEALRHVLGASADQHRMLLVPAGNMWDMREAAALAQAVRRELPEQEVAGEYLILGLLYELMKRDAPIIGAIAFGLVLLFTLLDLRSLRSTLGAIAVLLAGVAWWGALLVAADIKISIVNFVGIPIVLGIGIDVMIHLIHRMMQEGPGRIQKALATTGWASALGTCTTVVAFAALSLASSEGIGSLGLLVLLGETAVTLAGFVLVPLGFATTWRLQGRHPPPHPGEPHPGEHHHGDQDTSA